MKAFVFALALAPALALAHGDKHAAKKPAAAPAKGAPHEAGKEATFVGEVIDPVCFLDHGDRGASHMECAKECAKNGVNLAILEEGTDQIYLSMPTDHTAPNAKLLPLIARRVKVTGEILRGGGIQGISIKKVTPLGP
jgi:hypothetical protein